MVGGFLLQLPDPDTSPARQLQDGDDTYVVWANNSADALAFVQNYAPKKVWANVTPAALAAASDMSGWSLRVRIYNALPGSISGSTYTPELFADFSVTNASQVERVVLASGVLTSSQDYGTSDTVTIGTRVYSFVATPAVDGDVKIAGTESASITNLANAINNSGGTPGTDYVVTAADPNVTAVAAAHTLTVTARTSLTAAAANAVATTDSMTTGNGVWGHATLTGGVDSTNALSSLAELMVAALIAAGYHAGFVNSSHVLTVSSIADGIGDHKLLVEVTPPSEETPYKASSVGVSVQNGVGIPGFVTSQVDGGSAGAALTVTLVADSYAIPTMLVKAKAQQS
jgi:hypothetical protein